MQDVLGQAVPKKIYLASPYSHTDLRVVQNRAIAVCRKTGEILQKGYLVFSPIAHCHFIARHCKLPGTWSFWEMFDRAFIEWADEVWILRLPEWEESTGFKNEIEIAHELEKPIRYIDMDTVIE